MTYLINSDEKENMIVFRACLQNEVLWGSRELVLKVGSLFVLNFPVVLGLTADGPANDEFKTLLDAVVNAGKKQRLAQRRSDPEGTGGCLRAISAAI
ncbi:hypothetical protein NST07_31885 [Paenibacillus sp. FSL L8-0340]|uniref:hypothetical protein n=1 Tax=Paenibacillus sp. FSL L8-0340 TaxID=2954685 RepID=UPI00315899C8